jgi:hypothetical protein
MVAGLSVIPFLYTMNRQPQEIVQLYTYTFRTDGIEGESPYAIETQNILMIWETPPSGLIKHN